MPSAREIRRRIRSIKNTTQITRAMEMVSAAKMRRAQEAALASRPYAEKMTELVADLAEIASSQEEVDPLLQNRPIQRLGLIVITADRGLAGPFNANVIRNVARFLVEQSVAVSTMAIGRRGRDWLARHGTEIIAEVSGLPTVPSLMDVSPISANAIDGFRTGRFDRVDLVFNQFVSTTVQRVVRRQILPVVPPAGQAGRHADYIFEPSAATVLSRLLPRYVEVEIYQAALDSAASEHSARMIAMHNATQNAKEITTELTLSYNKARQAGITKEILEIAAGAEALAG